MSKVRNSVDTPDQHPGLEPPIKESSEQQGMAPGPDDRERLMPVGKPGVRVGDSKTLTEDERTEWISKRAYFLWEQAGRPEGRDAEHWEQAISDFDERGETPDGFEEKRAGDANVISQSSETSRNT